MLGVRNYFRQSHSCDSGYEVQSHLITHNLSMDFEVARTTNLGDLNITSDTITNSTSIGSVRKAGMGRTPTESP